MRTSVYIIVCAAFLGIFAAVGAAIDANRVEPLAQSAPQPIGPTPEQLHLRALLRTVVHDFRWSKGGFGSVMIVQVDLENQNEFDIKDIELTCELSAPSGTVIDRRRAIIYERIKAKQKLSIVDFNMGIIASQSSAAHCSVTDVVALR